MINLLELQVPIIQAPMAGVTTPEFVAASAEAGALGSVGAGYLTAEETRNFILKVKGLTEKPFAVNLFVPEETELTETVLKEAIDALREIQSELSISSHIDSFSKSEFNEQVEVIIDEGVRVCSFTFGLPDEHTVMKLKKNKVYLIGTATTMEEAMLAEKVGMDAVVIQGSEAGGHRGSFTGELIVTPLHELLTEIIPLIKIPVIAAGGIANKEMMDRALDLGAEAVQIGTALLVATESGANAIYKQSILDAVKGSTTITTAFSGKAARGIRNHFIDAMQNQTIAPYPYQNDLTKEIRKVAASLGKKDYLSLWAGTHVHLSQQGSVAEILNLFK